MSNDEYMQMLYKFNYAYDKNLELIIHWKNGLKIRCISITGVCETDIEPDDVDYAGDYDAYVEIIEFLEKGNDDSIVIFNDSIEISMTSVPEEIVLKDGTVLWARKKV
ncbi:MAG: hypothetical protein FWC55_08220 [Firmicutes bacterium]|nr:hypothetical protein [Bacillota bacterium]